MIGVLATLLRWILRAALAAVLLIAGTILAYRWIDPPITPLMLIRQSEGATLKRETVRFDEVAPMAAKAVIASEDNRFCTHAGIDMDAVQEAIDEGEQTGRQRGASTITMQVARNLFLWPGGGYVRKAVELPIALAIDASWPKRRVLEVYLNIAEWGPGVFGIQAAARHHFRIDADQLTREQAVRLAVVLPSPRRWDPARATPFIQRRTAVISRRIDQLGAPAYACLAG